MLALALNKNVLFEKNGFNPADEHFKKKTASKTTNNDDGLITKAKDIFTRVPTLWALFCEILACQGLSTLLNVLCVTKVSEVIPDDTERAGWMGKVSSKNYNTLFIIRHALAKASFSSSVLCNNQCIKLYFTIWNLACNLLVD